MAEVLTAAAIAEVQAALRKCVETKELCRKGQACGFDMQAHEALMQGLEARLQAVLKEFGHGRRIE